MTTTTSAAETPVSRAEGVWRQWAAEYPDLVAGPSDKTLRQVLHRVSEVYRPNGVVVDLGGGMSIVNGLLAAFGMHVHVFDIFEYDLGWVRATKGFDYSKLQVFLEAKGVKFINIDVCKLNLRQHFEAGTVDAVVSHHCLEHLHQSPKAVLESALVVLKSQGLLLIEVPNAVNVLKRVKVLRGFTNYSAYEEYFESDNFTGHIREYSVGDLHRLMQFLGVENYTIYGKNWYGTLFDKLGFGLLGRFADGALRRSPGLCGSLFLRADRMPERRQG